MKVGCKQRFRHRPLDAAEHCFVFFVSQSHASNRRIRIRIRIQMLYCHPGSVQDHRGYSQNVYGSGRLLVRTSTVWSKRIRVLVKTYTGVCVRSLRPPTTTAHRHCIVVQQTKIILTVTIYSCIWLSGSLYK